MLIFDNSSPIYPLWAFLMVALSLILVPRKDYQYLLPHGILGVFITGILLAITINIIKAWKYVEIFPFSFWGISIFILLAWGAALILFFWGIPKDLPAWTHYIYISLFAFIGIIIDNTFHNLGLRPYSTWYQSWMWFPVLFFNFWINYKLWQFRQKYHS